MVSDFTIFSHRAWIAKKKYFKDLADTNFMLSQCTVLSTRKRKTAMFGARLARKSEKWHRAADWTKRRWSFTIISKMLWKDVFGFSLFRPKINCNTTRQVFSLGTLVFVLSPWTISGKLRFNLRTETGTNPCLSEAVQWAKLWCFSTISYG